MVKTPVLPGSCAMTGLALDAQSAAVFVILSMTGNAGNRCIPERFASVAFFTFHFYVFAQQRESGEPVVKKRSFPRHFVMAACAFPALLPLVHIVLQVAGVTGFAQFFLAEHALVTGSTLDSIVFAPQGEPALLKVVEARPGPAVGGVAFFAPRTELAPVSLAIIVFAMTRVTPARCFLVVLVRMAGFAPGFPVATDQREAGLAVIEAHLVPAAGNVAVITRFAKAPLVLIIFSMTGITIGRRQAERFATWVAIGTFDFRTGMRSGERKIRPLVVKRSVVQVHYFCLASLMFGMAITARVISNAPVIAGFILYILGNFFMLMATQAQLVLPATLECLVTGLALVLEPGMSLYQVAWCNHCIERTHVRIQWHCDKQQYQSNP